MAMSDTGGVFTIKGRTAPRLLAAILLLAVVISVVVLVLSESQATVTPTGGSVDDRQEITERLVNEGYLPKQSRPQPYTGDWKDAVTGDRR